MRMGKLERAAIEAIANHFSATWDEGDEPPDSYVVVGGQRIAVDIATAGPRIVKQGARAGPRLRFDRVALRFVTGLRGALHEAVPDGTTVVLTVTAPIRLPAKTAAALVEEIRSSLAHRSLQSEFSHAIHGNQIRFRLLHDGWREASKLIGFVHNPDSDADALLALTEALIERIAAKVRERAPMGFVGDRWLDIVGEGEPSHIETYRQVCAPMSFPTEFKKVVMVLPDGRVEALAG